MIGDLVNNLPTQNPALWAVALMGTIDLMALILFFLWEATLKRIGLGTSDHAGGGH